MRQICPLGQNVAPWPAGLAGKCLYSSYMHGSPVLVSDLLTNVPGNTQMSLKTKVLYFVLGLAVLAVAVVISHFFGVGMRVVASAVWGS